MKKAVYWHLWRNYGDLPLLWVGVLAEMLRTAIVRVMAPVLAVTIIVSLTAGDASAAKHTLSSFLAIYALAAVVGAGGELLSIRVTDKRYKSLLLNYYSRLLNKDIAFYRDDHTGRLSADFRHHLDGTMNLVRLWRSDILKMAVSLVGPIIALSIIDRRLGALTLVTVGVLAGYVTWSSSRANPYRKEAKAIYNTLNSQVIDEITNIVAFKSSGNEGEAYKKIAELGEREMNIFWHRHKIPTLLDVPRTLLTALAVFAGLRFIIEAIGGGITSIGPATLVFFFLLQISQSVADLPDLILRHDEHVGKVHPTLKYLTEEDERVRDPEVPEKLYITEGAICIRGVRFSYKKGRDQTEAVRVFEDLNLTIKGGEHVGIVGRSGTGKSTLAGLLMRFFDVDSGSISIDGIDIRNVRQTELRRNFAYVDQEPLLFSRTIKDNIAYFKPAAGNEEIERAAKAAYAHEFIVRMEDGYATMVGERGTKLSAGQKQRLIIARAILRNPPLLIFDEATSALDGESEQLIQRALPDVMGGHTAIVIAQRLSTLVQLDRILVIDQGRVVEEGKHQDLLNLHGHYYSLWQAQHASSE
jgi:ATP-binding cassette, subfamily B, bacterial